MKQQIKILKSTAVNGVGIKVDYELTIPEDISAQNAKTLVLMRKAEYVGVETAEEDIEAVTETAESTVSSKPKRSSAKPRPREA